MERFSKWGGPDFESPNWRVSACHRTARCRRVSEGGCATPGGVLDFGLDGGVPPGPRDPNPCLEVKKVPMFRDFAQKMDPCLGIF